VFGTVGTLHFLLSLSCCLSASLLCNSPSPYQRAKLARATYASLTATPHRPPPIVSIISFRPPSCPVAALRLLTLLSHHFPPPCAIPPSSTLCAHCTQNLLGQQAFSLHVTLGAPDASCPKSALALDLLCPISRLSDNTSFVRVSRIDPKSVSPQIIMPPFDLQSEKS
jgi:hypothetical protein